MSRPAVDVMDCTFVVAAPAEVAARIAQADVWRVCWPTLRLTVTEDRGVEGIRWRVDGEVRGSGEIWLQPWGDGVLVHWFLRAEPARAATSPRRTRRIRERLVRTYKAGIHELKDRMELGRAVGAPRLARAGRGRAARTDAGSAAR